MKLTRIILDLIGWFQIVIGSTIIGGLIGGIFYYFLPDAGGCIILISLVILAFLVGVIWATRIWRRDGTVDWLSKIRRIT